jgi:prepilin-type N-terminal cleavage/methylation domain-containing protein
MKRCNPHNQKGFTLIETVIAILILSMTVGVLLTLTAGGIFSVRYSRNQIVADNLAQEALEYIRNSRDTAWQTGVPWSTWLTTLNVTPAGVPQPLTTQRGCFNPTVGCIVDPHTTDSKIWEYVNGSCTSSGSTSCPNIWFYPSPGFYTYPSRSHSLAVSSTPIMTTYIRRVNAALDSTGKILNVSVTVTWKNGTADKAVTQSMLLTEWGQ